MTGGGVACGAEVIVGTRTNGRGTPKERTVPVVAHCNRPEGHAGECRVYKRDGSYQVQLR